MTTKRPSAPAVAEMIRDHYSRPDHGAGGRMHVQCDDFNLGDEFFNEESRGFVVECGCETGPVLFETMKVMKETGRRKAVRLFWDGVRERRQH